MYTFLSPENSHYRKALECDVWFRAPISQSLEAVLKKVPYPLSLNVEVLKQSVHFASDDLFEYRVVGHYGTFFRRVAVVLHMILGRHPLDLKANDQELKKFFRAMKAFAQELDNVQPILFFMIPYEGDAVGISTYEENKRMIENEIIPLLKEVLFDEEGGTGEKVNAAYVLMNLTSCYIPRKVDEETDAVLVLLTEQARKLLKI